VIHFYFPRTYQRTSSKYMVHSQLSSVHKKRDPVFREVGKLAGSYESWVEELNARNVGHILWCQLFAMVLMGLGVL
jgi:hypothetical protein